MKKSMKAIAFFILCLFSCNVNAQLSKATNEQFAEVTAFDYSFYDLARRASWISTTHGTGKNDKLKFGVDHRNLGSARNVNKKMEDGRVLSVLHTHPKWTAKGVIIGTFPAVERLPANLKLTGSIGFIKPQGSPKSDGARFVIYIRYRDTASKRDKSHIIYDFYKRYDGKMKNINIDLSKFAGRRASFELRVDTGKKPTEDWAAWYNMHIYPKYQASPAPPKKPSTISKAVNASLYGPKLDEAKLFGHEFNFWQTVQVTKEGSNKIVTGRFSHAISFAKNDKYYFTAKFDAKGKLTSFERKIEEGFKIITPIVKYVANELVTKVPIIGGQLHVSDDHIDYLAKVVSGELGKPSWEKAADEIAVIIAVAALSTL